MGGEKLQIFLKQRCEVGSPPRGRGKGADRGRGRRALGITPAWAGKSFLPFGKKHGPEDHPRVGGEKSISSAIANSVPGSPPRGRGKEYLGGGRYHVNRITPAWAGKSAILVKARATRRDHPRVGGEKQKKRTGYRKSSGSPPRGRGKGGSFCTINVLSRITPAWAGKSYKYLVGLLPTWDHPRVGGEKTKKIP